MKKILLLLLTIMLVATLTACDGSDNLAEQSNHLHDIISIRNSDGDVIHYGMSRADVEAILGQGERGIHRHINIYIYGDDISILYRDDIAVSITVSGGSEWRLANGAYVGMQVDDQKEFYGMSLEEITSFMRYVMNLASPNNDNDARLTIIDYRFVLEDDRELRLVTTPEEFSELSFVGVERDLMLSSFMISFSIPDDIIAGIILGDAQALFTFS